ncbi:MAG: type II secretion system ATPase GspE [Thermodesulfovibrionales bacterium]|nr:type II secretion system ATPase GspE [Thermodesulfovibrionales bacterium]
MFKTSVIAGTIDISELPQVPLVLNNVSSRFTYENRIIPIEFKNNILKVVVSEPVDWSIVEAISIATSSDVEAVVLEPNVFNQYLSNIYGQESQNINKMIESISEEAFTFLNDEDVEDVGHLKDLASEAPIIRLVNMIISRAVESRASDIHIEPFEDEIKVRYRIDGVLHEVETIPKNLQPAIVSRIKIMAKLNIAERRLPQDGRIKLKVNEKEIDLRISTVPIVYGESVVMRILLKEGIVIDLSSLGFSQDTLRSFEELIRRPNGIILVTGPTGSGKTTTLYGALDKINSPDKKIITVEDPVEYQLKGVNQIQVKPKIGLNFANTLRHIVRQDPDIIMIGEIRDLETAEIAIQSALTGHLVFSTLHTNDAPSAITRLIDMGVENFLLSSTIRGIMAQRLVRVICPQCRKVDEESPYYEDIKQLIKKDDFTLYKGVGCQHCTFTGFYGRTGIYELLLITDRIRNLILKKADSNIIRDAAKEEGMKTLLEDGLDKVLKGITTYPEVLRVTQD